MPDQYLTIAAIARDPAMLQRVASCAAQQGHPEPSWWADARSYQWASAPGWGAKWDAAPGPDPGADPAVITDGDILSRVQEMLAAEGA